MESVDVQLANEGAKIVLKQSNVKTIKKRKEKKASERGVDAHA
jgi:hypothetical protein